MKRPSFPEYQSLHDLPKNKPSKKILPDFIKMKFSFKILKKQRPNSTFRVKKTMQNVNGYNDSGHRFPSESSSKFTQVYTLDL